MVDALPRRQGEVRIEILQLIAMNQVDQIDPLIANEHERASCAASLPTAAICGPLRLEF